jgi:HAD superfamily hydrolase (TIGR01662 family)
MSNRGILSFSKKVIKRPSVANSTISQYSIFNMMELLKKVVFLDRDGTINRDSADYIRSRDEFEFIPGTVAAIGDLIAGGFTCMVITNQSALARGFISTAELDAMHAMRSRPGAVKSQTFFSVPTFRKTNAVVANRHRDCYFRRSKNTMSIWPTPSWSETRPRILNAAALPAAAGQYWLNPAGTLMLKSSCIKGRSRQIMWPQTCLKRHGGL